VLGVEQPVEWPVHIAAFPAVGSIPLMRHCVYVKSLLVDNYTLCDVAEIWMATNKYNILITMVIIVFLTVLVSV